MQLISAFVVACAKSRFSHDVAQIVLVQFPLTHCPGTAQYTMMVGSKGYHHRIQISIKFNLLKKNFSLPMDFHGTRYLLFSGWLYPQGEPQLNDRFSYHSEITMPFTSSVINAHVSPFFVAFCVCWWWFLVFVHFILYRLVTHYHDNFQVFAL